MATLESDDSNILDAETFNWQLVIFPILAVVILTLGGFGYYYYQQNQREVLEAQAHEAVVNAKTPEELVKVADQFPHTNQATLALIDAANISLEKKDFTSAIKDYQRVVDAMDTDPGLRDSAQLGLASALEASGKAEDAISTYLEVAQRGDKSPYAPYAYMAAARIYEQRGDKANEIKILNEAANLDAASPFVKQAQMKLKELNAASEPPLSVSVPEGNPSPATPVATPAPVAPVPPPASPANKK